MAACLGDIVNNGAQNNPGANLFSPRERRGIFHAFEEMPAEGVRSRIYGEFRKIDLRYKPIKTIKTELGEDLILNGQSVSLYRSAPV